MLSNGTVNRGESFVSLLGKEQEEPKEDTVDQWKEASVLNVSTFTSIHSLVHEFFHSTNKSRVPALCQALYSELEVQKIK